MAQSGHGDRAQRCPLLGGLCCKTRMDLPTGCRLYFCRTLFRYADERVAVPTQRHKLVWTGRRHGGGRQRNLTSRLRFCAVAVSRTSSLAPVKPRSRSRSSLKIRFICANRISIFLRSRCDCWKASVLASARTRSRTSSLRSRVILRAIAVVHFGFNEQREQSLLLAL